MQNLKYYSNVEDILTDLVFSEAEDVSEKRRQDTRKFIKEALRQNRFRFIMREGREIGFFTWLEMWIDTSLYIHVNNLYIMPEHRNKNNLLWIRGFLKSMYPMAKKGYWYSGKKKEFRYRR